ncbi:DUF1289 domain-containing protein [Pseudooceanicola sp.]|uniref:DUF1289 domain-containing protein n=1 Tax=Pseudooceanicola sp. TaxID=1914328 RepID=UPI00260524C4|nr:DUF1289 domain-containing protein [Pseudooceanicola sp.]MDF1856086.1 DUF1289 domain-containing protein [Pseudooceanicola sp.]
MSDEIWQRAEIASPCIKICLIHPDAGLCTGCLRSRDEITMWSRYSDQERAAIIAELPTRQPRLSRRRGGRSGRLQRGGE